MNNSVWVRSTFQEPVDQSLLGMRGSALNFQAGHWYCDHKSLVWLEARARYLEGVEDAKSGGEPAGMTGVFQYRHSFAVMKYLLLGVRNTADQLGYHLVIGKRRACRVRQRSVPAAVSKVDIDAMLVNQIGGHLLQAHGRGSMERADVGQTRQSAMSAGNEAENARCHHMARMEAVL